MTNLTDILLTMQQGDSPEETPVLEPHPVCTIQELTPLEISANITDLTF